MIKIQFMNLALTPKLVTMEIPDKCYQIHLEFGGWYSDRDIYLWYKDPYSVDKCKKIISTKWKCNLSKVQQTFKILNDSSDSRSDSKTIEP